MGPAFDRFNAAALRPEKAVPAGIPQYKIGVLLHVADVPANVSGDELRQDVSMPAGHADGDDRHTKSRQTFVKRQHDNSPLCRGQQDGRSFTQFAAACVTPTVILFRGLFVIAVDVFAMMPGPKPSRVAGEPRSVGRHRDVIPATLVVPDPLSAANKAVDTRSHSVKAKAHPLQGVGFINREFVRRSISLLPASLRVCGLSRVWRLSLSAGRRPGRG